MSHKRYFWSTIRTCCYKMHGSKTRISIHSTRFISVQNMFSQKAHKHKQKKGFTRDHIKLKRRKNILHNGGTSGKGRKGKGWCRDERAAVVIVYYLLEQLRLEWRERGWEQLLWVRRRCPPQFLHSAGLPLLLG